MRERFSLDLVTLDRMTFLMHGNFGAGKTHLLGDMLREESKDGKLVRYINIVGEDGALSIRNIGLGDIGENVDTMDDLKAAIADCRKDGVHALAIDGGKWIGKLAIKKVCGARLPSVGKGSDDWTRIHQELDELWASLKGAAHIVVVASSSDRSMDQVSGELSLSPDLPGRQAAGAAGMFDFVFLIKSVLTGPSQYSRVISTEPVGNTIVRQRLPRPLPPTIPIPSGGGGWSKLMAAIAQCMAPGGKK